MKKILVVSAFNSGLNTGMLTVDLAFLTFMRRIQHLDSFEVHHVNAEKDHSFNHPRGGKFIEFKSMDAGALDFADYHRIIFWGDFLHSRRFHMSDVLYRWGKPDENQAKSIINGIFRNLLLEQVPVDILRRVIVFGSSLYINSRADEADPRYAAAMKRLYQNARLILLRDPISAYYAQRLGGYRPDSTVALDAAFLWDSCDLNLFLPNPVKPAGQTNQIGFSLGRTVAKDPSVREPIMQIITSLCRTIGAGDPVDIDWLPPNWDNPLLGLSQKIQQIRQCRLVVTDTYHCAVNAWREGVPAICVGRGVENSAGTFDDKKKEILYMMFNIRDYYLFSEAFDRSDWQPNVYARRMIGISENWQHQAAIKTDLNRAVGDAEARLTQALLT
ncbi:polysaccharide pyruvyl transferase family protein [Falsiroseomonas sp.]|uniref:polysaccharide pyruvyl transferase family protein n=1 Tax=Falsiroseomonas sp. TaxID=2870721 RepID=UPI002717E33F|nr:polysaccharide pyruvyl transferase family protein [Falsiroseomonas sp.]MDO9502630.1 polysaccharide pyruvyl transferase family protein [Falsiroseomonas sp.]